MSKEDKQRILATNRLLEILRAERSSEEAVSSDEVMRDSDLLFKDDEETPQHIPQAESIPEKETADFDEDDLQTLITDDVSTEKGPLQYDIEKDADVSEQLEKNEDLFQSDDEEPVLETDDYVSETRADPEVAKLAARLSADEEEVSYPSEYSDDIKSDLLSRTELPKDFEESKSKNIILPPEFNDTLITFYEDVSVEPNWKTRLRYLKRYFSDNKRKIAIYVDINTIYLLQTVASLKETEIEKVKSFSLPFEVGNHMITGINDLLTYVLENEIDPKDKKLSFGAYFSMNTPSKTLVIKSPKLKKKELAELVEWNANKNLSFSTENKSVNWEIAKQGSRRRNSRCCYWSS